LAKQGNRLSGAAAPDDFRLPISDCRLKYTNSRPASAIVNLQSAILNLQSSIA
jgi:hypothetical protein